MKVFLTEASGFIGGAVGRLLLADGYEVVGAARSDAAAAKVAALGMTPYRGDLLEPESLIDGVKAADVTINCGTAMSFEVDRGAVERKAVLAMLEAMVGTGKKFLYTSDQLIYGSTGNGIADEDTPLNPPPFIAWRATLEPEILQYTEKGVHAMIVRPVAVYGNGQDKLMPMLVQAAQQLGYAFYVGDGSAEWSVVHVDDLADLYALMIAKAPMGTVLLGTAETPLSMREMAEIAAEIIGKPGSVRALSVEEVQQLMGPYFPAQNFTSSLRLSGQRARTLLGWQPTRLTVATEARQGVYTHLIQQQALSS